MKSTKETLFSNPNYNSARAHFKFFRRWLQHFYRFSTLVANFFTRLLLVFPFAKTLLTLFTHALDILAFGTNPRLSTFSRYGAFIGYSLIMALSVVAYFTQIATLRMALTCTTILLGMYFDSCMILTWLENYHNHLKNHNKNPTATTMTDVAEARTMILSNVLTFIGLSLSALSLTVGIIQPQLVFTIFAINILIEIAATLGDTGKEKVNIANNLRALQSKPVLEAPASTLKMLNELNTNKQKKPSAPKINQQNNPERPMGSNSEIPPYLTPSAPPINLDFLARGGSTPCEDAHKRQEDSLLSHQQFLLALESPPSTTPF